MTENFEILFQYLKKENIIIDKTEFEFQIQSHPDYPSLLSIADTLTFFNINNGAIKVDQTQIDLLPDYFIAYLNIELKEPKLFFVEKKETNFIITLEKKNNIITKEEFYQRWTGSVLLIEKNEEENKNTIKNQKQNWLLPLVTATIFTAILVYYKTNIFDILFFIFPFVGVLFSIAALKDLFGAKSKIINNFCNITASTSCETVVNSSKWKFFEIINFSDLSIVFFSAQFISLFLCIMSQNVNYFFTIQKIVLLFAIPVIITSLYYQKIVEKKWCPICLVIISIIILEIVYVFSFVKYNSNHFSINNILLIGFAFLAMFTIWKPLKQLLTNQKKTREDLFEAIRFERNYENFKNNLMVQSFVTLPKTHIVLGNKDSKVVISIISNPFCGHCKNVHKIIDKILERNSNNICVNVYLKTNFLEDNEETKNFFRYLYSLYDYKNQSEFLEGLEKWFERPNLKIWNDENNFKSRTDFDEVIINHNAWCYDNKINFTPTIFINGYEYPKTYNRDTLKFFISDLLDDNF